MNHKNILLTIAVAVVLVIVGCVFVDVNPWLGYTDSAIVYLAAVVGAGCFWIGISRRG